MRACARECEYYYASIPRVSKPFLKVTHEQNDQITNLTFQSSLLILTVIYLYPFILYCVRTFWNKHIYISLISSPT